MKYLSSEQRGVINTFIQSKVLPDKVDVFFIEAVKALLNGFEAVEMSATELVDQLENLGPCDPTTFRRKIDTYINSYIAGKDPEKLRLVLKR